jgi:hypothetical protein
MRAALIYLHRIKGADRKIADGLELLLVLGGSPAEPTQEGPDDEDPPAPMPAVR